ncbi:MAG: right-handed parallel beta-helix repeat-containing protein [Planctomycetota bacterium]
MLASIVAIAFALVSAAPAATFYVDPVNGSAAGDGSAADPWRTLQEVWQNGLIETRALDGSVKNPGAPVTAGDTLLLLSGYHGELSCRQAYNDDVITVAAADGHTPELRRIGLRGASNWAFRGLTISYSLAPTPDPTSMVSFHSRSSDGICSDISIEDCFIYSWPDSSTWTVQQWLDRATSAINLGHAGERLTARNNRILNVAFGITVGAEDCLVEYNEITNFRGDGMRVMMHGAVVQYNVIKNCYNVDSNHDDGIQGYYSLSPGQTVYDLTLRGNVIINQEDPDQLHPGTLQGIGFFDGPFINCVFENNVVMVNHWHGITVYRAGNCRIVNNTIFNKEYHDGRSGFHPWIGLTPAGGEPANIIRNNIIQAWDTLFSPGTKVIEDHNVIINRGVQADRWFADYPNFDLRPVSTATVIIDTGSADGAPLLDADRNYRPAGGAWDIGAYEYGATQDNPVVADAGDDQVLDDANGDGFEIVYLDGAGSTSTADPITGYTWRMGETFAASGATAMTVLPLGVHTLTLTASTAAGWQDSDEVVITVREPLPAVPGDCDGDDDVDLDDFVILKGNFGRTGVTAGAAEGDLDEDGDVDLDDFVILKANFGH